MTNAKTLKGFLALFALVVLSIAGASALTIKSVEVSGVTFATSGSGNVATFAGDTIPVRVYIDSNATVSDATVEAWISGDRRNSVVTKRFDIVDRADFYSPLLAITVPSDIDPDEDRSLFVAVEAENGQRTVFEVKLVLQRESYAIDFLDVEFDPEVRAGQVLPIDVILKNIGRQFAEDTFVRVRIPSLALEDRAYFGDMSAVDQGDDGDHPEKEDAVERRMFLKVPKNTPAGIYAVEVEAYNGDSSVVLTRKISVLDASVESMILPSVRSKTFSAGQTVDYSLTLVNAGDNVKVYEMIIDSSDGLNVDLDEPVVAVPAGTSRTVKLSVSADKAGKYDFSVNVNSAGSVVKQERFSANVEGTSFNAGNATVLLTVVLAIVFVVLLVVLIVLLTRKPQKSEEFGESYY